VCRVCVAPESHAFYALTALVRSVSYGNTEGLKVQVPPPAWCFFSIAMAITADGNSTVTVLHRAATTTTFSMGTPTRLPSSLRPDFNAYAIIVGVKRREDTFGDRSQI
jgi:hypothetical protein